MQLRVLKISFTTLHNINHDMSVNHCVTIIVIIITDTHTRLDCY